jgi:hypothetical protein
MSCAGTDLIECDTVQIIEPRDDLLVDVAGTTNDMDERGSLELNSGQVNAIVLFEVPKLNAQYSFEYLYVDAMGNVEPGAVQIVPTVRAIEGFAVVFAGAPIGPGYVMHWRVVVHRSSTLILIDAPEDLYLQMPRTNTMSVTFHQPRSGTNYGFSELRVENLTEAHGVQAVIRVQVYQKFIGSFRIAVNPTPPSDFYFLKVRTP